MTVQVTVAPAVSAIDISLVKEHLRIIGDDDNISLSMYMSAAIAMFEQHAGLCLITQTIKQTFDQFPCEDHFFLERGMPLQSVSHVKYYDTDNVLQTMSSDEYIVLSNTLPPSICLASGESWPSDIHPTRQAAVEVTYVAGYGTTSSSVPKDLHLALSLLIGDLFQNREDSIAMPGMTIAKVGWNSQRLLARYKTHFYQHLSQSRNY